MKIVINNCYGGFGLSEFACGILGLEDSHDHIERNDPRLIALLEKHGSAKVSGDFAELKIVEIPDDVKWTIEDFDGAEHVAEQHRTWY